MFRGSRPLSAMRESPSKSSLTSIPVHVLAASGAELATSPAKILEQWAAAGFPLPDQNFRYQAVDKNGNALHPIPYKQLELNASWESFDLKHELTDQGIKKFVDDYKSTLKSAA